MAYNVTVSFLLGDDVEFQSLAEQERLSLGATRLLLLRAYAQPAGMLSPLRRFQLRAEAVPTEAEARAVGERLCHAVLWAAVSKRFRLRLDYTDGSPCEIEKVRHGPLVFPPQGYARVSWPMRTAAFGELLRPVLERDELFDRRIALSLELFAAARLEMSGRARFIALVSALEPLADPRDLGSAVAEMVERFLSDVASLSELSGDLRASLRGRIEHLRKESIRMALRRLVQTAFPGSQSAFRKLDDAYELRSSMLHNGAIPPDIDSQLNRVEALMRLLYGRMVGLPLVTTPPEEALGS